MPVVKASYFKSGSSSDIKINVGGISGVERLLNKNYWLLTHNLRDWLKKERSRLMGDRDEDQGSKKGFRQRLERKRRKRRGGTWAPQIAGQFKGYVSKSDKIDKLEMKAGLFQKGSKLKQGLEILQTGGEIRSSGKMIIPIYKNLAKAGYTGPMFRGKASVGSMTNMAFKYFSDRNELKVFTKGERMYAYHKDSRRKGKSRSKYMYQRSGLLFIGQKSITVRKVLSGTTDLIHMFNKSRIQIIKRGQAVVNRTSKKVR